MTDRYYISWPATALSAATAKTILELPTPAGVNIEIMELVAGCDATAAGSLKVEFGTWATTGTGTSATPNKWNNTSVASSVTGAKYSDTVEPGSFTAGSAGALLPGLLIPLPLYFPIQWPLEEGFAVLGSVNFGVRLTASVACNTQGWISWKE